MTVSEPKDIRLSARQTGNTIKHLADESIEDVGLLLGVHAGTYQEEEVDSVKKLTSILNVLTSIAREAHSLELQAEDERKPTASVRAIRPTSLDVGALLGPNHAIPDAVEHLATLAATFRAIEAVTHENRVRELCELGDTTARKLHSELLNILSDVIVEAVKPEEAPVAGSEAAQ